MPDGYGCYIDAADALAAAADAGIVAASAVHRDLVVTIRAKSVRLLLTLELFFDGSFSLGSKFHFISRVL